MEEQLRILFEGSHDAKKDRLRETSELLRIYGDDDTKQSHFVQALIQLIRSSPKAINEASSASALASASASGLAPGGASKAGGNVSIASLTATIVLKNLVKNKWDNRSTSTSTSTQTGGSGVAESAATSLTYASRHILTESLLPLLFEVNQALHTFLLETLEIMAETEVPFEWPTLLPYLLERYYKPFLLFISQNFSPSVWTSPVLLPDISAFPAAQLPASSSSSSSSSTGVSSAASGAAFGAASGLGLGSSPNVQASYASPEKENGENSTATLGDVALAVAATRACLAKFETAVSSDETLLQIKHVLQLGQERFLQMFAFAANQVISGTKNFVIHQILQDSVKIIKILHGVDLPEYFEDNLALIVGTIQRLLDIDASMLALDSQSATQSAIQSATQSATHGGAAALGAATATLNSQTVSIKLMEDYCSRYTEEICPYVCPLTAKVVAFAKAFAEVSSSGGRGGAADRWASMGDETEATEAVVAALEFLTTVYGRCWSADGAAPFLKSCVADVCGQLVLPFSILTEDSLEIMNDDPMLFVRSDLEGSAHGAKRESVQNLIRAMLQFDEASVHGLLRTAIDQLLSHPAGQPPHPSQEKSKEGQPDTSVYMREAASFLVFATSVKASTRTKGVTELYPESALPIYFQGELLPLLSQTEGTEVRETSDLLMKAAALKFVTQFRNFLPEQALVAVVPLLVKDLRSPSLVIRSYAANALERFVTTPCGVNNASAFEPAVGACFDILATGEDNEYVMRCLWRLLVLTSGSSPSSTSPDSSESSRTSKLQKQIGRLRQLLNILKSSTEKANNPLFVHYVFESVSILPRLLPISSPAEMLEVHEFVLSVMIAIISQEETHSFVPYAYQVVGCLLSSLPPTFANNDNTIVTSGSQSSSEVKSEAQLDVQRRTQQLYAPFVQALLSKERWTQNLANVMGIMAVLSAILSRPSFFMDLMTSRLPALLDGFLLAMNNRRLNVTIAADYLNNIIAFLPLQSLQPLAGQLSQILITKLQKHPSEALFGSLVLLALKTSQPQSPHIHTQSHTQSHTQPHTHSHSAEGIPDGANTLPGPLVANIGSVLLWLRRYAQQTSKAPLRLLFLQFALLLSLRPLPPPYPAGPLQAGVTGKGATGGLGNADPRLQDPHFVESLVVEIATAAAAPAERAASLSNAEPAPVSAAGREALLSAMAEEDERGVLDNASNYARLSGTKRSAEVESPIRAFITSVESRAAFAAQRAAISDPRLSSLLSHL